MRRHKDAVALAMLHAGDEPTPSLAPEPTDATAPRPAHADDPMRGSERDRRIADLLGALNVGGVPAPSPDRSPVRPFKPSKAAQQARQASLNSHAASALSQATTAEGAGRYRYGGGGAATNAPGARPADKLAAPHRPSRFPTAADGERAGGHGRWGHPGGQGRAAEEEVDEDLDLDEYEVEELSYYGMDESIHDDTGQEEDPFDVAADAVLAAARSRCGQAPNMNSNQNPQPAAAPSETGAPARDAPVRQGHVVDPSRRGRAPQPAAAAPSETTVTVPARDVPVRQYRAVESLAPAQFGTSPSRNSRTPAEFPSSRYDLYHTPTPMLLARTRPCVRAKCAGGMLDIEDIGGPLTAPSRRDSDFALLGCSITCYITGYKVI
jgi:hypothetical protein